MNDLMARAVLAARIVTGVGLQGVRFPYVPRTLTDHVAAARAETFIANPTSPGEPPFDSSERAHPGDVSPAPDVWLSVAGVLGFDDNDGLDETRMEIPFMDMNGGKLFRIRGPADPSCSIIPVGAEWSVCPYDVGDATADLGDCVEIVDDEVDCDDSGVDLIQFDRNLGIVMRSFGDGTTDGSATLSAATSVFADVPYTHGRISGFVPAVLRSADQDQSGYRLHGGAIGISSLTNYWRRSFCGAHNSAVCDMGNVGVKSSSATCDSNIDGSVCTSYVGCNHNYWGCLAEGDSRGFDFAETFDGNRAFIAPRGLTANDVINGLEIMCAAARRSMPGGLDCSQAPEINTVGDLFEAEAFLQCQAGQIRNQASRVLFNDLPARAVSLVQEGGVSGAYGTAGGEYRAGADELRAALIQYADINTTITTTLGLMAADIRDVRSQVRALNLQTEIADWQLASTLMSHAMACTTAIANAASVEGLTGGQIGASAAICADAVGQSIIAGRINELGDEANQQAIERAFAGFERSFVGHMATMSGSYTDLRTATALCANVAETSTTG